MFTILQAPYIIYVEVLEVEDLYTSPVPTKIMGSSLRHTKSEENLTGGEQSNAMASSNISVPDSQQNSTVPSTLRQTPVKNISPYTVRNTDVTFNFPDDDPNDCWSQEDDEITQQVYILFKCIFFFIWTCTNLSASIVFAASQAERPGYHIATESRVIR